VCKGAGCAWASSGEWLNRRADPEYCSGVGEMRMNLGVVLFCGQPVRYNGAFACRGNSSSFRAIYGWIFCWIRCFLSSVSRAV
jgi:hypothetical protein